MCRQENQIAGWQDNHWCTVIKQRERSHEQAVQGNTQCGLTQRCYATGGDLVLPTFSLTLAGFLCDTMTE